MRHPADSSLPRDLNPAVLATAEVIAIDSVEALLTVRFGGDAEATVDEVPYLAGYTPTVGDLVTVLRDRWTLLVLGSSGPQTVSAGGGGGGGLEVYIQAGEPPQEGRDILWANPDEIIPPDEGGGDLTYTHIQSLMATTWTVTHNLGKRPVVAAQDAVGNVIHGSVRYEDDNTLTVTFKNALTGRVDCN